MARQRSKGFTLVELLVVIGIIALLISILLPALNKAREEAKLVQCASNMRQLAQAVFIYQDENNGFYPPAWGACAATSSTSPNLSSTKTPCLYEVLLALPQSAPQYYNARVCPAVLDIWSGIPSADPQGNYPLIDPRPAYGRVAYSYKYNNILGGCDTDTATVNVGHPVYDPVSNLFYPRPLTRVQYSAETAMFIDYPQIQCACVTSDTITNPPGGDNRGFKGGTGVFRAYPGTGTAGFLEMNKNSGDLTQHQTIGDINPVHSVSINTHAYYAVVGAQTSLMGIINVAYCDGSVRPANVTQGNVVSSNNPTTGKDGAAQDSSSGGAGWVLMGEAGTIPGTRFDPTQAP